MAKARPLILVFAAILVVAATVLLWLRPEDKPPAPADARIAKELVVERPSSMRAEKPKPDANGPSAESGPVPAPPPQGEGRVSVYVALRDGTPAAGIDLSLLLLENEGSGSKEHAYTGTSDGAGKHDFDRLPWGEYVASARKDDLASATSTGISVYVPHRSIDLVLKPAGAIQASVEGPDHRPVEGARIQVLDVNNFDALMATVYSDPAGNAQVSDVPIGSYALQVEADGYAPARSAAVLVGGPPVVIVLGPGGTIAGSILSAPSKAPAPDVTLIIKPERFKSIEYKAISDAKGKFVLERVPDGPVMISSTDDVYALTPGMVFADVGLDRVSHVNLTVTGAGRISGTVSDAITGEAVEGAVVVAVDAVEKKAGWKSEPTDAEGRYVIPGVSAGPVTVRLSRIPRPYPLQVGRGEREVEIVPGEAAEGIDFAIDSGTMLCGVVVDEHDVPSAGAKVSLGYVRPGQADAHHYGSTTCDQNGKFCFSDIELSKVGSSTTLVSEVILLADNRGARSQPVQLPIDGGAQNDVVLKLEKRAAGVIGGTVVNEKGQPVLARMWLARAEVGPNFDRRGGLTDIDGYFLFQDIGPGNYELRLAPEPGGMRARRVLAKEFSLRPDEKLTDLRLVLPTGSKITGRVTTEKGEPLWGVPIDAIALTDLAGDEISSAVTDRDGYFTLNNLDGVEFEVMHSRDEDGPRWSVRARPGDDLNIVLPQSVIDDIQPSDLPKWLHERQTGIKSD